MAPSISVGALIIYLNLM